MFLIFLSLSAWLLCPLWRQITSPQIGVICNFDHLYSMGMIKNYVLVWFWYVNRIFFLKYHRMFRIRAKFGLYQILKCDPFFQGRASDGTMQSLQITYQNCFSDNLLTFDSLGEKRVLECFSQEIFVHCGPKVDFIQLKCCN